MFSTNLQYKNSSELVVYPSELVVYLSTTIGLLDAHIDHHLEEDGSDSRHSESRKSDES